MKIIKGGITKPKGFKANGLSCGIKRSGKPDLGLIYCDIPCLCSAVFTKNSIKAAPLLITQQHLRDNKAQAIIINSGNANCFTGNFGLTYAKRTTEIISKLLGIKKNDVLVASTGIIGKPLPIRKIQKASKKLADGLNNKNSDKLAKSILTTDKKTKEVSVQFELDNKIVTIGACAKGSGMIAPNMATMLAFITTDVKINSTMLKLSLKKANENSFNCITIDGCMSTNDMAVVMSNGLANNKSISKKGKDFNKFTKALSYVCLELAKMIILDGEGATKFIVINVIGARTKQQAKRVGLMIANSNLVKTAAYGNNPNWGRVAAAVGSLSIDKVSEKKLKINFSSFAKKSINITVDLNIGFHKSTVYTCDLSYEYIKINGEYN